MSNAFLYRCFRVFTMAKKCYLRSLSGLKDLILPNNEETSIGRDYFESCTDKLLSRKHISFLANYNNKTVRFEVLGSNCPLWNGYLVQPKSVCICKNGDIVELICGNYSYEICILDEENGLDDGESQPKKQKQNENSPKKQKRKYWDKIDNGSLLTFTRNNPTGNKIAGFDIDGTLINTKSGAKFAKDSKDWQLAFPNVKEKLKELEKDGYNIVFFTNQAGIQKKMVSIPDFKQKIEAICDKLDISVKVSIATDHSKYRKPCLGMWEYILNESLPENSQLDAENLQIDVENSFYVGDAAGRPKETAPNKKRDHSCVDRLFAINIGLKFYTPEEFFLSRKPVKFNMPEFDPRNLQMTNALPDLPKDQECIIMVGGQGSGKSHFCTDYLIKNNYEYINRDLLGNMQKCIGKMENALINKKSVVVDNTNGTKEARKKYLDVCKKLNVPCRCFRMTTTVKHCLHNNKFRSLVDKKHNVVGDMVIYSFFKNFEAPGLSEGFREIIKVDFMPKFDDSNKEKLYKCFLLEN